MPVFSMLTFKYLKVSSCESFLLLETLKWCCISAVQHIISVTSNCDACSKYGLRRMVQHV